MRAKHHTQKPTQHHIPCITKGCNNYYNIVHLHTNEKCKPCREKDKRKKQ